MSEKMLLISKKINSGFQKFLSNKNYLRVSALIILAIFSFNGALKSQPEFFRGDLNGIKLSKGSDYSFKQISEGLSLSRNENLKMSLKGPQGESKKERRVAQVESELKEVIGEYPIKEMIPYIAKYDRDIAGLIVGIAKKESNWGKRVPVLNGQDCYNYWGYRGAGTLGKSMGYGCFASPKEGVEVIGRRIAKLASQDINTPREMVVWKCGSSCAGHPPENVRKWIADVSIYFNKISKS